MLKPLLGRRRGYLRLYMPDYSWIALVCGSLALVSRVLHAGLIIGALRKAGRRTALMRRAGRARSHTDL